MSRLVLLFIASLIASFSAAAEERGAAITLKHIRSVHLLKSSISNVNEMLDAFAELTAVVELENGCKARSVILGFNPQYKTWPKSASYGNASVGIQATCPEAAQSLLETLTSNPKFKVVLPAQPKPATTGSNG